MNNEKRNYKKVTMKLAREIALKIFGKNVPCVHDDIFGNFEFKTGLVKLSIFPFYEGCYGKYPNGSIHVAHNYAGTITYMDGEIEFIQALREKYDLYENAAYKLLQSVEFDEKYDTPAVDIIDRQGIIDACRLADKADNI